MTHAEMLRSHADLAIKEGGMYYSGEYLSRIATVAESIEAENAKLRELCKEWYRYAYELFDEFVGEPEANENFMTLEDRLRKMGIEPY